MTLRFALLSACFVLGLIALDQAAGVGLRAALDATEAGDAGGAVNHAMRHGADRDIAVFGTSRAACHVDSERVGDALGRSVYNAGANGQRIPYGRMVLHLMIDVGFDGPLVLLQAEPRDLFKPEFERARFLAPFALRDPLVFETLQSFDPHFRVKMLSAVYPFNSKLPSLLKNMGAEHAGDQYSPRAGQLTDPPHASDWFELGMPAVEAPDPLAMALYRDFVAEARAHGIDVFMFTGPFYREGGVSPRYRLAQSFFEELAAAHEGVVYEPMMEDELADLLDGAYFSDPVHLNREGAEIFSDHLAARVLRAYPEHFDAPASAP